MKKRFLLFPALILAFCLLCGFACAERETVEMCGTAFAADASIISLRGMGEEDVDDFVLHAGEFTDLKTVYLGTEDSTSLSWESIARMEDAAPEAEFLYYFTLYGRSYSLAATELDLNHITIDDQGELVRQILPCMKHLAYLDMDFCGVDNEHMAAIRDDFPNIKVVWRIWFGSQYSVRTDVEKILASQPSNGGMLYGTNADALKYCTEVKYLDIGHNEEMTDISFVSYMPKLEVLIVAMSKITDISALSHCPELEYLEVQTTRVEDLTPLIGLTKLRHLNICDDFNLTDLSPVYSLTGLERLWIGRYTPIPEEQVEIMQKLAPDCVINTTAVDPHDDWRWGNERYELLSQQFGYAEAAYAFKWKDPLYNPHD